MELRLLPRLALVSVSSALLITNPASRRGARTLAEAEAAFRSRGVDVDTVLTERQGHAALLAEELASRYDAVFTLGGDGTAINDWKDRQRRGMRGAGGTMAERPTTRAGGA